MKLAIFDFDGTLFQNETLPYILKFWYKNKYPKGKLIKTYLRILKLLMIYKLKLDASMDKEKFRAKGSVIFIRLFEHLNEVELKAFFKECSQAMTSEFNEEVKQAILEKKASGYHIVICSGAYEQLLYHLKDYLPIDTIIGTKLFFTTTHYLDYTKELKIITGVNKPKALLNVFESENIDWKNSYAYGDSYYDFEILSLTGNPIAVQPDKKLRAIALEKNWPIIS